MGADSTPGSTGPEKDLQDRLERAERYVREEGYHQLASELTLGLLHKLNNLMTAVYFNLETAEEALDPQHPARAALRALTETIGEAQVLVRRTADLNLPPDSEASYHEIGMLVQDQWDLVKLILSKNAIAEFTPPTEQLHVRVSSEEFCEALLQLALTTRAAAPGARTHVSVEARSVDGLDLTGFQPQVPQIANGVAVLYRDDAGQSATPAEEFRFETFRPERGGQVNRLYRAQELIRRQGGALAARQIPQGVEYLILLPGVS